MNYSYVDIIAKKRDGIKLSESELRTFVNGICDGSVPDYQTAAFLMAVAIRGMDFEETVALTLAMRDSGEILKFPPSQVPYVDKHSTGGVGDSVTMVILPVVAALGLKAPKLSGRGLGFTGGTIDKLNSIKGFNTELSSAHFAKQVQLVGLAVASQTENLAPADKILYQLRDVTATVGSLPLIVSSIMSKKLAGGADVIVLDVKYGNGALMPDEERAAQLADWLVRVGTQSGKKVSALLSDMNQPLSRFIGNSLEVYGALEVLKGEKNALYSDAKRLSAELLKLSGKAQSLDEAEELVDSVLQDGRALKKFEDLVRAQGGDVKMLTRESLISAAYSLLIPSPKDGIVSAIDTAAIGEALIELGGGRRKKTDEIDYEVGFEMLVRLGDTVKKGDPLVKMYFNKESQAQIGLLVQSAIKVI